MHTREATLTCEALRRLAGELAATSPDTIIISSPHAQGGIGGVGVYIEPVLAGSFSDFGYPQLKYSYKNNLGLAEGIVEAGISGFEPLRHSRLGHGELVFLDYLEKAGCAPKLVVLSAVWGEPRRFFEYGKLLGELLRAHGGKLQFVASGDLSHCTKTTSGRQGCKEGVEFDRAVCKAVASNDPNTLLEMDGGFIQKAQQCGLCSFLLGFGVMDGRNAKGGLYSYEDPFGVGYLVGKISEGGE